MERHDKEVSPRGWPCSGDAAGGLLALPAMLVRALRRRRRRERSPLWTAQVVSMARTSSFPALLFFVVLAVGLAVAAVPYALFGAAAVSAVLVVGAVLVAAIVGSAVKVAAPWDRAIVLRLGRFRALRGPGVFGLIPIIDTIPYWIDTRVITTAFKAEKTLTRDTVPVDVDAVLFWQVVKPEHAALQVADYVNALSWAAQTALRDIIGKTQLADMLEGRDKISTALQRIIDERTEPWGVKVISVEVRDVLIPPALQDAMSMQAQAERERQARVILGDSERQVAESFREAAATYTHDPVALHLRAMNMLYEGLKQNATIVLVPSSALESMQLGARAGVPREGERDSDASAPGSRSGPH
jgi:regulator of protease activity HflC (stomatin/prohibitin superfamily)